MKIPSLKQQYFGDLNRQLNARRRQMNADIRGEILERIQKDKQAQDESLIEESDLNNNAA